MMDINHTYCGDHLAMYIFLNHYVIHMKLMLHVNYAPIFKNLLKISNSPKGQNKTIKTPLCAMRGLSYNHGS